MRAGHRQAWMPDPGAIRGDEAYAGYVIACDGKNLVRGNTLAGTTNAVYGFLRK